MPRAVELIRVSTKGQADRDTPEIQRHALDRLRASRPCVLVERIEAPGISGGLALERRPDLMRLAELSHQRAYDELRVYALDRLTRSADPRERMAVFGMVGDAGAVIVETGGRVIDPAEPNGMGELDYFINTFGAARERARILQRTMDGRRRAAANGTLSQGSPPFGRVFDHASGTWVLSEPNATTYRRIFAMLLDGMTTREIAAALNADRVPPPRGNRWAHSTIKKLLHSPVAYGEYRTMGHVIRVPPIVDEATFGAAQHILHANLNRAGPPGSKPAMLRRALLCGVCGRTEHVFTWTRRDPLRYGCPRPADLAGKERCPDRALHLVAETDERVRLGLERLLTRPDLLRAAAGLDKMQRGTAQWEAQQEKASKDLQRLTEQESRLLRLMDDGAVTEEIARQRLKELHAHRAAAEAQKRSAEELIDAAVARSRTTEALDKAAELGERVRGAPLEKWSELVKLLFPRRDHLGLRIFPDGRIEGRGRLPLGPRMAERVIATAGNSATSRSKYGRTTHLGGTGLPFRFRVPAKR